MFLSRLRLNTSRVAVLWAANPYRVHQRLAIACEGDPRLLFRIEDTPEGTQIIVQSHVKPNWDSAFNDFQVLRYPPEQKSFEIRLQMGRQCRFRLLANPTVKKSVERDGETRKTRLGLFLEDDQRAWLARKLEAAGAKLLGCAVATEGMQRSKKNPSKDAHLQTHFAALFEGTLQVQDPVRLRAALEAGIGSAKGFGFGLLSLAPAKT